jgi:hypothetical protein
MSISGSGRILVKLLNSYSYTLNRPGTSDEAGEGKNPGQKDQAFNVRIKQAAGSNDVPSGCNRVETAIKMTLLIAIFAIIFILIVIISDPNCLSGRP